MILRWMQVIFRYQTYVRLSEHVNCIHVISSLSSYQYMEVGYQELSH